MIYTMGHITQSINEVSLKMSKKLVWWARQTLKRRGLNEKWYKLYTCTTFKAKTVGINWTKSFSRRIYECSLDNESNLTQQLI